MVQSALMLLALTILAHRSTWFSMKVCAAAGVHKHYGYAFQWFALSALILGLYVWFQLIRPRRARQGSRG